MFFFYFKDVKKEYAVKTKSLIKFFTLKHATSGISMRNRTAISRKRESYH